MRIWRGLENYFLAVVLALIAVGIRWLLIPLMGNWSMYATVVPVIVLMTALAGLGPGIAAVLTGILAVEAWLIPPPGIQPGLESLVRGGVISASSLGLGYLGIRLRATLESAHQQAEALQESNDRYRALGEAVFEAVLIHQDGEILDMNDQFCTLFGYRREEILHGRLEKIIALESQTAVWRHVRAKDTQSYAATMLCKDGSRFQAEIRGKTILHQQHAVRVVAIRDITAYLKQQEELRLSRDQLQRALEAAEMGTWDADLTQGQRGAWDRRCRRLLGVDEEAEFTYPDFLRLVHPEDRPALEKKVEAALAPDATGKYVDEYRIRWPDGSGHWILAMGQVYFEGEGPARRALRFTGVLQDITSRKQAEDALRQQRELLDSIIDRIPVMVTIYDATLKRFRFNREFQTVLGWREEDMADGREPMELFYPDPEERQKAAAFMQSARPGTWHEFLVQARDGSRVESAWANIRLVRGTQIGIGIDLRARRRTERSLQRLYESGIVGVLYWNAAGAITDANETFLGLVGHSQAEVAAGQLDWTRMTPPEFREKDRVALAELRETGVNKPYEKEFIRKDGSRVAVLFGGATVDPGRREGIAFVLDITERRRAEEALREADRRKDEFLAMIAHELRNPLAPIRNAVYLLRQAGPADERLARPREIIDHQVGHMARLLDDLLDLSRIARGKFTLKRQPVRLEEVIGRAVENTQSLIARRGHRLHWQPPGERLWVDGDFDRLTQVVGNLLTNAAKYTYEGGQIWVSAGQEGAQAVVRVRDSGVGIEPAMLAKVFDLFTQSQRTLDRSMGGLGIGLSIVKRITEMHGGQVAAFSQGRGQGSEFTVRLPLVPAAKEAPPAPAIPRETGPGRHRILVVEDVVDAADSLTELLRVWGYQAHAVYDGLAALSDYQSFHPDVVLMDIGLPGLDGFALSKRLRSVNPGLKIVAMSGYSQEQVRTAAEDAGIEHYLMKPVDLDQLHHLLAQ